MSPEFLVSTILGAGGWVLTMVGLMLPPMITTRLAKTRWRKYFVPRDNPVRLDADQHGLLAGAADHARRILVFVQDRVLPKVEEVLERLRELRQLPGILHEVLSRMKGEVASTTHLESPGAAGTY